MTQTADMAYFTRIDNWIGSYLLIVMGLLEVVVTGWILGIKGLDEINRDWIMEDSNIWFYKVFYSVLNTGFNPLGLLLSSTKDCIASRLFPFDPKFREKITTIGALGLTRCACP